MIWPFQKLKVSPEELHSFSLVKIAELEHRVKTLENQLSVRVGPHIGDSLDLEDHRPTTDLRHVVDEMLRFLELNIVFDPPRSGNIYLRKREPGH